MNNDIYNLGALGLQRMWGQNNPYFRRELNIPSEGIVPLPNYRPGDRSGIVPLPGAIPGEPLPIQTLEFRKYKPSRAELMMQQNPLNLEDISRFILQGYGGY